MLRRKNARVVPELALFSPTPNPSPLVRAPLGGPVVVHAQPQPIPAPATPVPNWEICSKCGKKGDRWLHQNLDGGRDARHSHNPRIHLECYYPGITTKIALTIAKTQDKADSEAGVPTSTVFHSQIQSQPLSTIGAPLSLPMTEPSVDDMVEQLSQTLAKPSEPPAPVLLPRKHQALEGEALLAYRRDSLQSGFERWSSQIKTATSPKQRQAKLKDGLEVVEHWMGYGFDEEVNSRKDQLRLLVSRLEVADVIEKVSSLQMESAKQKALEHALKRIRDDDLPDELQAKEIEQVEALVKEIEEIRASKKKPSKKKP